MAEFDPTALRARLESLRAELPYEITTRPMMGGFIGYADGRVFVSMSSGGGFGIKLLPADHDVLLEWLRRSAETAPGKTNRR